MKRNQEYTREFRAEAVKVVLDQGLSLGEAAKRLSIPKGTLTSWVGSAKRARVPGVAGARTVAELELEVRQLRKQLAEARMERDVLKKATAYFARESLQGTRS